MIKENFKMRFIDIYILINKYDKRTIDYFLNTYLVNFEQAADCYEFPQYSDNPTFETESVIEILDYLISEKNSEYTIYWNNPLQAEIINGMIFFCNDSSLILGLSVIPEKEGYYLEKLKNDFKTNYCLCSIDELPPLSAKDFIKVINSQRNEIPDL